ncbi:MAG: DMT family transporter [Nanobdellota archaeon]
MIRGALLVIFAAILWGLDGTVLTPRLHNLDVSFVVFLLHIIPLLLMSTFLYREYNKLKVFSRKDYLYFSLIALFGGALGTIAIVKALFLVNFKQLSVVVLLQKLQPVFAILLARILLKEKLGRRFFLWAGLAIVASYFLTFGLNLPNVGSGTNTLYASLMALLAAFSFGISTVLGKGVLNKYDFKTSTFYRYFFTSIIMTLFVLISGKIGNLSEVTNTNWLYIFIIGITTGSGAIFIYYYGLKRIRASLATICELFFPLSAIIFDYLINDAVLSPAQWVAAAILVFSVIRVTSQKNTKKRSSLDNAERP